MVVHRGMRSPAAIRGPSSSEATSLCSFPSSAASDACRILDSSDARRLDGGAQNRSHSLEVSRDGTCVSEEVYPRFPRLRSSKSFSETGSGMMPLHDDERASPLHHHRSLSFSRLLAKSQNLPSLFALIDGEPLSASMEASAHPSAEKANDGEEHCEPVLSTPSSGQEPPYILPEEIGLRSADAAWGDETLGLERCGESDEGFACLAFAGLTKGRSTSWDYEAQGGSPATVLGVRDIQRLSGAARLHLSLLKRKGESEGWSCSAASKSSAWAFQKTHSTSSADGRRAPPGTTEATAELFVDLLQTLEAAAETMTKMEEQVSHHARRAEQLNARLERAVAHNDSMYAESEQLERRLRQAKTEVEALRSRCAGLEKKPDYRERYVASERGRAELERQVKQLQAQVDAFRAGALKQQRQREEMEEEVSGIKKRLEEKEEQLLLTRRSLRSAVEQNSQLPDDSVPPQSSERRGRRSYFISGQQLHLGPALSLASPRQLYRSPRSEAFPPSPRPSPSSGGEARCVKCGCVSIPLLNVEGLSGSSADPKQTALRTLSSAPLREPGRGQGDEFDEGHEAPRGDSHDRREKVGSLSLASGASFSTAPPTGREVPASSDGARSGRIDSHGGFGLVEPEGEEEGLYDCGGKNNQKNGEAPLSRQDAVARTQRSLPSHCNSGRVQKAETVEGHSNFSSFSFADYFEKRGADWADAVSPRRNPLVGEVCHNCRNETRGASGSGDGRPSPLFSHVGDTDSHRSSSLSLGSSLPVYSLPSVRARRCPTPAAGDSGVMSSRGESTWRRLARSSGSASYTLSSSPCRIASSGSGLSFGSVPASPVDEGRENPSSSPMRLTSLCGNGRAATRGHRGVSGVRQRAPFSSIFSPGSGSDGTLDRRAANQPAPSMFEELLQVGQSLTEEEARMKRTLDGLLAAVAASPVPFEELATKGLSKECLLKIRKLRQNAPKNSHATQPAGGFFSPVLYPLLSLLFDSQRLRCSDTRRHRLFLARVKALPRAVLHFLLAGFFRESGETKHENEVDEVASDAEAPSSASSSPASYMSSLPGSSAAVWQVVKTLLAHVCLGSPAFPRGGSPSAGGTEGEAESTGRRAMRRQKTQRATSVSSSTGGQCSGGDHGVEQNADHGQAPRTSTEEDTLVASEPAKRAGLVLLLAFLASTFFSTIELPLASTSPLAPSGL
ncbi:UNVERIFIED_CONTAM: hypothetical protein HHA_270940 [Hammondia hammondi]|eukprot:XP_008882462.1 hypothetical protein HHA_270940 [Hammondia hammondi]